MRYDGSAVQGQWDGVVVSTDREHLLFTALGHRAARYDQQVANAIFLIAKTDKLLIGERKQENRSGRGGIWRNGGRPMERDSGFYAKPHPGPMSALPPKADMVQHRCDVR